MSNKTYLNNKEVQNLIYNGQILFSWVCNDQEPIEVQAKNAREYYYAFTRMGERLIMNKIITEEEFEEIKENVYFNDSFIEYGRIIHEELNTLEDLYARYKKGEPIPLVSLCKW
jgi:hypothetical protein